MRHPRRTAPATALLLTALPAAASVSIPDTLVRGSVTADNHYALYTSTGPAFTYHGGNETGAAGSFGRYNWSDAESHAFEPGDFLYIAAWSDDRVAQGVLAEFHLDGFGAILSGDSRWRVYASGVNLNTGDPHPDASAIAAHASFADANRLWEPIVTGGENGVAPWGGIAGIDPLAAWMWRGGTEGDPLRGSFGQSEMLVFRVAVPAPGALALVGLGGLLTLPRRR
jgi:hypothetical protein